MAATTQNLKDFFGLTGNKPAVTNDQLISLGVWFTSYTGIQNPTPDDFIDYIYDTLEQRVIRHRRQLSVQVWD